MTERTVAQFERLKRGAKGFVFAGFARDVVFGENRLARGDTRRKVTSALLTVNVTKKTKKRGGMSTDRADIVN